MHHTARRRTVTSHGSGEARPRYGPDWARSGLARPCPWRVGPGAIDGSSQPCPHVSDGSRPGGHRPCIGLLSSTLQESPWLLFCCSAVASSWMPGRRPWKADYADGSTASNATVVVVLLFGHVGGEERAAGEPGVGGASVVTAPRSRHGGLVCWQQAVRGWREGFFGRKPSASAPAAAMPAGVVTLLRVSLWYLSHTGAPGENP